MRLEIGNLSVVDHPSNDPKKALTEDEIKNFISNGISRNDWTSISTDSRVKQGTRTSNKQKAKSIDAFASPLNLRGYNSARIELHSDERQQPLFVLHQDPEKESKLKFINLDEEPNNEVPDLLSQVYTMCKNFLRSKNFLG